MVVSVYTRTAQNRGVGVWLILVALLVYLMIVVGGATRLTQSGLSIVRWEPVKGVIPPLDDAEWKAEFEAYKQYPQYRLENRGMTVEEFKDIYWWEYGHRLLGRVIGVVFVIPFLWFLFSGRIGRETAPRLVLIFMLGGIQGALGWYMVASGLVDQPAVSHLRLAAHLMMALLIYSLLLWTGMTLVRQRPLRSGGPLRIFAAAFVLLVFLQLFAGALVAGLHAGFIYNDWPTMDGAWIPGGLMEMKPWWENLFNARITAQFEHRLLGYLVGLYGFTLAIAAFFRNSDPQTRLGALWLLAAVSGQIALGIFTLVNAVPVPLGVAHQAGGIMVLTAALYFAHTLRRAS